MKRGNNNLMNITITDQAKEALSQVSHDKMIQLSMDPGSCDIVNTIYEMKVVPLRENYSYEKLLNIDGINIMIDGDIEETYDHELNINYSGGSFVFSNRNQIFNNRIRLRFV